MVADRLTIFGIKNCDSVKKARQWLLSCNVPYEFHDFRTQGLPPASLDAWIAAVGHIMKPATPPKRVDDDTQTPERALHVSAIRVVQLPAQDGVHGYSDNDADVSTRNLQCDTVPIDLNTSSDTLALGTSAL